MTPEILIQESLKQHGHRALRLIDGYWHSHASSGTLPRRADIDPGAIQDALEFAFIADRVGACHARMRVAGGAIGGVFGGDAAGLPLSAFLNHGSRATFDAALARCFDQQHVLEIAMTPKPGGAKTNGSATLRLYPLGDGHGTVRHLLGAFAASGPMTRAPLRFDIMGLQEIRWTARSDHRRPAPARHLRLVIDNT